MFTVDVSKDSIRKVVGKKRLPRHMLLYVTGDQFFDILEDNDLSYKLMHFTYCLTGRSVGRKTYRLSGQFSLEKGPKIVPVFTTHKGERK